MKADGIGHFPIKLDYSFLIRVCDIPIWIVPSFTEWVNVNVFRRKCTERDLIYSELSSRMDVQDLLPNVFHIEYPKMGFTASFCNLCMMIGCLSDLELGVLASS